METFMHMSCMTRFIHNCMHGDRPGPETAKAELPKGWNRPHEFQLQMLQARGATAKAKTKAKGPLEVARPKPKPLAKEPGATTLTLAETAKVAAKEKPPAQKAPSGKNARPASEPAPAAKKAKAELPPPPPKVPQARTVAVPAPPPKPEGFKSWSPVPPPPAAILQFQALPRPPPKTQDKICCMSCMPMLTPCAHLYISTSTILQEAKRPPSGAQVWLACMKIGFAHMSLMVACMHGL